MWLTYSEMPSEFYGEQFAHNRWSACDHNTHCSHSQFAAVVDMTVNVMNKAQSPQTTSLVASHRHAHRHAFSSGQAVICKRQAQRRQQIHFSSSRGHNPVLAVAASDVGHCAGDQKVCPGVTCLWQGTSGRSEPIARKKSGPATDRCCIALLQQVMASSLQSNSRQVSETVPVSCYT